LSWSQAQIVLLPFDDQSASGKGRKNIKKEEERFHEVSNHKKGENLLSRRKKREIHNRGGKKRGERGKKHLTVRLRVTHSVKNRKQGGSAKDAQPKQNKRKEEKKKVSHLIQPLKSRRGKRKNC